MQVTLLLYSFINERSCFASINCSTGAPGFWPLLDTWTVPAGLIQKTNILVVLWVSGRIFDNPGIPNGDIHVQGSISGDSAEDLAAQDVNSCRRQTVLGRDHSCGMMQPSVSSVNSSTLTLFIDPPTAPDVLPITNFSWMSDFSKLLATWTRDK